jgi:hypothetical protein
MAEGASDVARVLSPGEAEAWRAALERDFPEIDLLQSVAKAVASSCRPATPNLE